MEKNIYGVVAKKFGFISLRLLVIAGLLIGLGVAQVCAQIISQDGRVISASVNPHLTEEVAEFTIQYDVLTGVGTGVYLEGGDSRIVFTFPEEFELPTAVSTDEITIDGKNAFAVEVNDQSLSVTVPEDKSGGSVDIIIKESAGIYNPDIEDEYTINLTAENTRNTHDEGGPEGSFTYFAEDLITSISQPSVVPGPSVESLRARYTISFSTGARGAMNSGDEVIIEFDDDPSVEDVPSGSIAGVDVNGTSATNAHSDGPRTIIVPLPNSIEAESPVEINFARSSGLRNPLEGNYRLDVSTDAEPEPVESAAYLISSPDELSFSEVDVSNSTVNSQSDYEIRFVIGAESGLFGNNDRIRIGFPENTVVPSSINTGRIQIGVVDGFSDNPVEVSVEGQVVDMVVPFDIEGKSEVIIHIDSGSGILNPSSADNYRLMAETLDPQDTVIDEKTESNPYSISAAPSTVDNINVTADNFAAEVTTNYHLDFTVGEYGRLEGGFNTVTVRFASAYDIPDDGSVTIEMDGWQADQESIEIEDNRIVTFEVPDEVSVDNNQSTSVSLNGITNPEVDGDQDFYSLDVHTSAETSYASSPLYAIGGTRVENVTVSLGSSLVNQTGSEYNINFDQLNTGQTVSFYVRFPEGTLVPEDITTGDISTNIDGGSADLDDVIVNDREVRLDFSRSGGGGMTLSEVEFEGSAGITNPPIPNQDYSLQVWSSENANESSSDSYQFSPRTGESPVVESVSVNPNPQGFVGPEFQLAFTPGSNGRMVGGSSFGSNTVTIQFPQEFTIPGFIDNADVDINGIDPTSVEVDGNSVIVGMPAGEEYMDEDEISLTIFESAGIENPTEEGIYGIDVYTDVKPETATEDIEITGESELAFTSVSLGSNTVNDETTYTLLFRPGTFDEIEAGDSIILTFPSNTHVPSEVETSDIIINGVSLNTSAVRENEYTLKLSAPEALQPDVEHTINFSSNSGLINPSTIGSDYTIGLQLFDENGPEVTSPDYSLDPASSTISDISVDLESEVRQNPNQPGELADYHIDFMTGSNGRLEPGESFVTVRFPSDADVSQVNNAWIEEASATVTEISADQEVTIGIPAGVEIGNSSSVDLVIENVENPGTEDDNYTVEVNSSVEEVFIESSTFVISSAGPVTIASFEVLDPDGNPQTENGSPVDTVNTPARYRIEIDTDVQSAEFEALEGEMDDIILEFPDDTELPSAIENEDAFTIITSDGSVNTAPSGISISENRVTLPVILGIGVDEDFIIIVNEQAGITNPSEPAGAEAEEYRIRLATSKQPNFTSSEYLNIVPSEFTAITPPVVKRTTDEPGEPVKWEWNFTTGSNGALKPGVGQIKLQFNANEVDLSRIDIESVGTSNVRVNTDNSAALDIDESRNELLITISSNTTIGRVYDVEVTISETAGIWINEEEEQQRAKNYSTLEDGDNDTYSARTTSEPNETGTEEEVSTLPIELELFEVNSIATTGSPELNWTSATERENEGFRILRSSESSDTWTELDFIPGAGTTTEPQEYSFIDNHLSRAGVYLYKLIQVDYDGTETEYGPIKYRYGAPADFAISQNYPNPFNPVTVVPYQIAEPSEVRLDVYNILGRHVQTLVDETREPGTYNVEFDGSNLASGIYIIHMQAGGVSETMEITLVK